MKNNNDCKSCQEKCFKRTFFTFYFPHHPLRESTFIPRPVVYSFSFITSQEPFPFLHMADALFKKRLLNECCRDEVLKTSLFFLAFTVWVKINASVSLVGEWEKLCSLTLMDPTSFLYYSCSIFKLRLRPPNNSLE